MVTAGDAPFNSAQDVVNAAKARAGEISYASSGHGGPAHLAAVLLEALGKAAMAKVRFAGNAPALAEVMAGRVSFMFHPMAGLDEHVEQKRLKLLAAGTEKRLRDYPRVPTMAEAGFPGFERYAEGVGLAAPAGTPTPIVGRLNEAVRASLAKADTRGRFKAAGALTEGGSTPEHFAAWLAADRERWQRLISAAGVKAE
jgi:tripartite-type tricarboxylate transporter receptor subunit TctC